MSDRLLAGWRVVITRAEGQSDTLAEHLRAAGAEPIAYPTIAFAPPQDTGTLDAALDRLAHGQYDWLVLTSANAVRLTQKAESGRQETDGGMGELLEGEDEPPADATFRLQPFAVAPSPASFRIAAVGSATAAACRTVLGREPAVVPDTFVAESLAAALGDMNRQRVLLLNSDLARPNLATLLREAGADVDRVIAYRTVPASGGPDMPALLATGDIDALTFASGSAVRFFVERVGPAVEHARKLVIACIGPVTAAAARDAGLSPTVVAAESTSAGLVEALVEYVKRKA